MSQSLNRKLRRAYKRKLGYAIDKVFDIADKAREHSGLRKMFISVNTKDISDVVVINYLGNERLEKNLGSDVILNLGKDSREHQLLVLVEYSDEGQLNVYDGQLVFTREPTTNSRDTLEKSE